MTNLDSAACQHFRVAAQFVLLLSTGLHGNSASAQEINVTVIDEKGNGVKSALIHISSNGEKEREVTETDDNGKKKLKFICAGNDQWRARPISTNYYESKAEFCGPSIAFKIVSKPAIQHLWTNAELAEKNGNHWAAALYYTDITAWIAHVDPETARAAEEAVYSNFGMALNIDEPVARSSTGKIWLTPSSREALVKLQGSNGLPETGMLDYRTLREFSGVNVFPAYKGTLSTME